MDDDIPYQVLVESMGLRRGHPQVRFPSEVDSIDSPANVVYSLRIGHRGELWFPGSQDRCGICLEYHDGENPLFYSPCAHLFHGRCWDELFRTNNSHPHRQRLNGTFERAPNGDPILDQDLTKCPTCRSYVANDEIGTHSHQLIIPFNPSPSFPRDYEFRIGRARDIDVYFVNREVPAQPNQSSPRTGLHSNHCGPLAVFNLHRLVLNQPTCGPQVSASLERQLSSWSELIRRQVIPSSSNVNPQGLRAYIDRSGFSPDVLSRTHIWCPTVQNGERIPGALEEFINGRFPLPLIVNNGNHWFAILLRLVNDNRINIEFMEPWDAAIPRSMGIIHRFLFPQLTEALENEHPPPLLAPSVIRTSAADLAAERALREEQDREYLQSLEADRDRDQEPEEVATPSPGTLPNAADVTEPVGPRADSENAEDEIRRTRRDQYWSLLNQNQQPPTPPPRNRPNRRYDSEFESD